MNKLEHALADSGAEPRSVLERWSAGELLQTKRARSHQIGRVLIGMVGVVVLLGLLGADYESVAEAAFVGSPPVQYVERASGVSEVETVGPILRCLVSGSFQPFLEALRGHEVVSLTSMAERWPAPQHKGGR